jgi:hypothetical protein
LGFTVNVSGPGSTDQSAVAETLHEVATRISASETPESYVGVIGVDHVEWYWDNTKGQTGVPPSASAVSYYGDRATADAFTGSREGNAFWRGYIGNSTPDGTMYREWVCGHEHPNEDEALGCARAELTQHPIEPE